jgi:beta-galactosidase
MTYYRIVPEHWADRLAKLVALGANTVEIYVPWNLHELKQGEYDFSGRCDITRFLDLCADANLDVLLRPGPYVCGEWEFGGLPWWLLNEKDITLRSSDPCFLKHVDSWWEVLIPRIRPYLSSKGGPITAIQIENEYGYYGNDQNYLEHLRDKLRHLGVDILLFTSDGPFNRETLLNGGLPDVLRTANFGSNPDQHLSALRAAQPKGPLVCMEFWVGWFDAWGNKRKSARDADSVCRDLKSMLSKNTSVNIFMFCGGTSFGFMSGANNSEKYEPHVTSYDYDGLLTECGDITPKYLACQKAISSHTRVPISKHTYSPSKKLELGEVLLTQQALLLDTLQELASPVASTKPMPLERLGEGYGYVHYRADVPAAYRGMPLRLRGMRDYAHVMLNRESVGTMYVNDAHPYWKFDFEGESAQLDILVDCMARPNFGHNLMELKGISDGVFFGEDRHNERALFGWESNALPMRDLSKVAWSERTEVNDAPAFYRARFEVEEPQDTFLALPGCRKGFAAINGFNLGRYWDIGPQYTLYIPGPVLKKGINELIVFDVAGTSEASARLQNHPDFAR